MARLLELELEQLRRMASPAGEPVAQRTRCLRVVDRVFEKLVRRDADFAARWAERLIARDGGAPAFLSPLVAAHTHEVHEVADQGPALRFEAEALRRLDRGAAIGRNASRVGRNSTSFSPLRETSVRLSVAVEGEIQ
jgi:hypothetical protein